MTISNAEKKSLRQLGHSLKPVVTVGEKGVSETVLGELNRALDDHELIKVKLRTEERDEKKILTEAITSRCGAELVQAIGNIILIYRKAEKQNARLSNVLRGS